MIILAIETSCDETSAAVVENGDRVLSNVVSSQVEFHKKYGGVVPEIAARKHTEVINAVIQEAVKKVPFKKIDAVAVTYGPGLVGALLVGICAAQAIAYSLKVPLIGVNHLEGHIYASKLAQIQNSKFKIQKKFICLIVSGGHTMIVEVKGHGKYNILGRTRDDAAGEAFDKVARLLNLGYPGGPIIDKLSQKGNPEAIKFTRPMLEDGFDFSFSGIKTAVVNYVQRSTFKVQRSTLRHDLVASFQEAVVDVLVEKTLRAAKQKKIKTVVLAGGVAANSRLRQKMEARCRAEGLTAILPPPALCTDNAAMIGAAAYYHVKQKKISKLDLAAAASIELC
jgi:N6-L-threonylcarbamoyladenine synthase